MSYVLGRHGSRIEDRSLPVSGGLEAALNAELTVLGVIPNLAN